MNAEYQIENEIETLDIELSKPQSTIFKDKSRFRISLTGRRFGKTYLLLFEILRAVQENDNSIVVVVCPNFGMAKHNIYLPLKSFIKSNLDLDCKFNDSELRAEFGNGCELIFGSDDAQDSLRGRAVLKPVREVFIDEAQGVSRVMYSEIIRPMLSDKKGQDARCTVFGTFKVIDSLIYELFKSEHYSAHTYTTLQGGNVSESEILQAKKELDERAFRREYMADIIGSEGLVYYNFTDDNIVNKGFDKEKDIYLSWDFNATVKPMSTVIIQEFMPYEVFENVPDYVQQDEPIYIAVKEFVNQFTQTFIQTEIIRDYLKDNDFSNKVNVTGDFNGKAVRSGGSRTDFNIIDDVLSMDYQVELLAGHVKDTRDRVNFTNAMTCNYLGKRKAFVNSECKKLIKDKQSVIWRENGREIDGSNNALTHISDAESYYFFNFHNSMNKQAEVF